LCAFQGFAESLNRLNREIALDIRFAKDFIS